MGRLLALDIGKKRTGIAVTDPLKMIASPLDTVDTTELIAFLKDYQTQEELEKIIVGMPKNLQNNDTDGTAIVANMVRKIKYQFNIPLVEIDERFTSKMAFQTMLAGGLKKKDRQKKETIDKVSATIILQSFMESNPTP